MMFNLGVFSTMALAAGAVLIPPTMNEFGDDNAMETLAVNPFKRTVALECPGCALATQEDGGALSWTENVGNTYLLDFEVGVDEDSLHIDGVQLYPPTFSILTESFHVTQVEAHSDLRLRVTGYTFGFNDAETITEAGTELLPMTLRITSLESAAVNLPALTINLLKNVDGKLMIASFQEGRAMETSPTESGKDCKEWPLLCKWRSILADRVNSMSSSVGKGCHKMLGAAKEHGMLHAPRPGHDHHHHPHPHPHPHPHHQHGQMNHHSHHHGHHHDHHRFHMLLRHISFTVFIPILIGIFAGTVTYLIGMALGFLIAVVIAKIRGRSLYDRVALEEEDEDEDVEGGETFSDKEVYADLPAYEAPPVYAEAAEKEVVDGSH